jgi:hypothetical protein
MGEPYTGLFQACFMEYLSVFTPLAVLSVDWSAYQTAKVLFEGQPGQALYEQLEVSKILPEKVVSFTVDPKIRSWLTEFLSRREQGAGAIAGPPVEAYKLACLVALKAAWAQISQRMRSEMRSESGLVGEGAENRHLGSTSAGRVEQLSKEFLDLTRRMNDLSRFIHQI